MNASEIFKDGLETVKTFIQGEASKQRFSVGQDVWFKDGRAETITINGKLLRKTQYFLQKAIVLGISTFSLDCDEKPVYAKRLQIAFEEWGDEIQVIDMPERAFYDSVEECQKAVEESNRREEINFRNECLAAFQEDSPALLLRIALSGSARTDDGTPNRGELARMLAVVSDDVLEGKTGRSIYAKDGTLVGRWDIGETKD